VVAVQLILSNFLNVRVKTLCEIYLKIAAKPSTAFLFLSFRRVLDVICFFLGNSPASEF